MASAVKLTTANRRRLAIVIGLFAVFSIVGFFVIPPVAKSQLEKRLSAQLGRQVAVERIRVNPYALSVALENFSIRERDGTTPFLGWSRLYVRFNALSSLWGEWVLGDVELEGFNARVVVNADQSLNFSDILARVLPPNATGSAAPSKPGRPVRVDRLQVSDARVDFSDLSRRKPFATSVGPSTFVLTGFHTAGPHSAPYHFEAVTESGEKLAWSGTLRADPVQSVGEFTLEEISLAKYAPYYSDFTQAEITAGKLSVGGRYELGLDKSQKVMKWQGGTLKLSGLKVLDAGRQAAVELPDVDVAGVEADALTQKATVGTLAMASGHLRVRREKDGSINLLAMLQPREPHSVPAPSSAKAAAPPAKLPDVTIGQFTLKDFAVELTDLAAPRPAQLGLSSIQLSLKNVTLAEGAQMPLNLAFNWAPHGTVQVDGAVGIMPVKADLKVGVAALEILPLSPYLEQFLNARITDGNVTTTLAIKASLPEAKPLAASVTGDIQVQKFGLVDAAHNEALAGFNALTLQGLHAETEPGLSIALDEVWVAGPYARAVVNADKSINLAGLLRPGPPGPPAPAAPLPVIKIGAVTISDGECRFADRSVEPNVTMAIDHFGGTISGLSSANPTKADVDLRATVDSTGPISISGRLDPLGTKKSADLTIACKNVDLLPLSPYSGEFAGYELARGKLFVDVKLVVDDRIVSATNVITADQFTFGSAVNSPEATHLPVRLGVALLKDVDGKIVIDAPVQGSIDDPSFKIGRVVLRVIVNLLTKAAVSPFSLLGSMFGGGGDELAYQEFVPGSSELQQGEIKKLQTMTLALKNRPALSLDLSGSYDAGADASALKQSKLRDRVRRAVWEARRLSDPNIAPPEQLVISPEENAAMVKKLFDEKFPPGTQFGTPLPPPPAVIAPPAPPAGFVKRIVAVITFQSAREKREAEKVNAERNEGYQKEVATAKAGGMPLDEMTGRLADAEVVTDDDLRGLAASRAQHVRDYLSGVGHIGADRLFLSQGGAANDANRGPRVFLSLQ
jgi:uncharacterized protein DUF748